MAVTMRTPGEDEELAAGFLAGEALIAGPADIASVGPTEDLEANVVEVRTTRGLRRDPREGAQLPPHLLVRRVRQGGARARAPARARGGRARAGSIEPQLVIGAPGRAREGQAVFDRTGGLHATRCSTPAASCSPCARTSAATTRWTRRSARCCWRGATRCPGALACLSGRVSFELVQKAALARLAGVVAVGAPTSLAVQLAEERGLLLCGFVREGAFNVYAGADLLRDG